MKKPIPSKAEMLSEYNFDYSKAKNNRFAADYHVSVTLDPDVASVFKTSESVNKALRAILSAVPSKSDSTEDLTQQNSLAEGSRPPIRLKHELHK